jgi:hypothetical protein
MEITLKPLRLDKQSLVQWKIMDMPTSFIWIIIFFDGVFKYGDGTFKLLRWMKNLHQLTWDHQIFYADRSSKDEQPSVRPLFRGGGYEHGVLKYLPQYRSDNQP